MITASQKDCGAQEQWVSSSNGDNLAVPGTRMGVGNRLAVLFRSVINRSAPIGYEDEAGYHYGELPAGPAKKME